VPKHIHEVPIGAQNGVPKRSEFARKVKWNEFLVLRISVGCVTRDGSEYLPGGGMCVAAPAVLRVALTSFSDPVLQYHDSHDG